MFCMPGKWFQHRVTGQQCSTREGGDGRFVSRSKKRLVDGRACLRLRRYAEQAQQNSTSRDANLNRCSQLIEFII